MPHFLSVSQIRDLFIDFFVKREHEYVSSSSLLPENDSSLLFTTAGMVQFKPLFSGNVPLPYLRAVSYQKCLRTTDLEQVGKTDRHCTFFEMLGNFSFGDYFKQKSIEYSWDFSLNYLNFPKEKIWITVYLDDDEAFDIWKKLGVEEKKIIRLGKKDNFWGPAGETGACGPCSELYFDRGIEKGCENSDCKPGCDCDRFIEFWNIVFNQYYQDQHGNLQKLTQTGIDTGAGLERVATLIQEVDSVYETDELKKIIQSIESITKVQYQDKNKAFFRIIADHIRAASFSIADGIFPDRVGRGYVIRRLIRRALLAGRKLNANKEAFLYLICDSIYKIYSEKFPEIKQNIKSIQETIFNEENLFLKTLDLGLDKLNHIIAEHQNADNKVFSGKNAFLLYGTYGFPLEATEEILIEKGFSIDKDEFYREMEADRENSRVTWQGKNIQFLRNFNKKTDFIGYELETTDNSIIEKILSDQNDVQTLSEGQDGILILQKSPFYPEGGGQRGDIGEITLSDKSVFLVSDTQKESDVILHFGKVKKGFFRIGDIVAAKIDVARRKNLKVHHSATHLLNFALRKFLGEHVYQKSSLVEETYLRFDFSHSKPLSEKEIEEVEDFVNEGIQKKIMVSTKELPIEEAKKTGAIAVFGEKYGGLVRVVQMGDRSTEFCGGTHVSNTSEVQFFTIKKESSPGVGVRRIEAICNLNVVKYYQDLFHDLAEQLKSLKSDFEKIKVNENWESFSFPTSEEIYRNLSKNQTSSTDIKKKFFSDKLKLEQKKSIFFKLEKKQKEANLLENSQLISSILDKKIEGTNFDFVLHSFLEEDNSLLKSLLDILKNKNKSLLFCFLNRNTKNDSFTIVMACSQELTQKIHCGNLLKQVLSSFEGKGGGKANMAQGGFGKGNSTSFDIEKNIIQILK